MKSILKCTQCGRFLSPETSPCPKCGSDKRSFLMNEEEGVSVSEGEISLETKTIKTSNKIYLINLLIVLVTSCVASFWIGIYGIVIGVCIGVLAVSISPSFRKHITNKVVHKN